MERRILDVGCGRGAKYPFLRRRGAYVGIDISEEDIDYCRRHFRSGEFLRVDPGPLPFPDGSFQEVHLYDVLEHIENRERAIREVHRVLVPGGRLIVESPYWKSETVLVGLLPDYLAEVGHKAILREDDVVEMTRDWFRLVRRRRKHGLQNVLLRFYIARGGHIIGQSGKFDNDNRFLDLLAHLFSEDLFFLRIFRVIPLWLFFPVWIVTLPIGMMVSRVFPKTIRYEFMRNA